MLKRLAILAVLSVGLVGYTKAHSSSDPVPTVAPGSGANQKKPNAAKQSLAVAEPITVAPITIVDKQKTFWDHVLDWGPWAFNCLLVVAAGFQVWLLFRTWVQIKSQAETMKMQAEESKNSGTETLAAINRQADSMDRQVEHMASQLDEMKRQANIMDAAASQWVEAQFCEITTTQLTKVPNSAAIETAKITLRGRITNPTPLPLTLSKVRAEICKAAEVPTWECFDYAVDEFLAPTNVKGGGYPFSVTLALNKSETSLLSEGVFNCGAAIHVSLIEAGGKDREQTFRSLLLCGTHKLQENPFVGNELNPSKNQEPRP